MRNSLTPPTFERKIQDMDPNATLAAIRALVMSHAEDPLLSIEVDELVTAVEALDEWISKGGFLPEAWAVDTADTVADAEASLDEWTAALAAYPNHAPRTAWANYQEGREVWDTNGDLR